MYYLRTYQPFKTPKRVKQRVDKVVDRLDRYHFAVIEHDKAVSDQLRHAWRIPTKDEAVLFSKTKKHTIITINPAYRFVRMGRTKVQFKKWRPD